MQISKTYDVVATVVVRELSSLESKMFFHEGINDELFANGMASNFPGQLTSPAGLSLGVSGILHVFIIVLIHLKLCALNV
jgi:hypothetical protein